MISSLVAVVPSPGSSVSRDHLHKSEHSLSCYDPHLRMLSLTIGALCPGYEGILPDLTIMVMVRLILHNIKYQDKNETEDVQFQ